MNKSGNRSWNGLCDNGGAEAVTPDPPSRRRRGRPRLDADDPGPSVNVHVRLSSRHYDRLYQVAKQSRMSMADWIRKRLQVDPPRGQ